MKYLKKIQTTKVMCSLSFIDIAWNPNTSYVGKQIKMNIDHWSITRYIVNKGTSNKTSINWFLNIHYSKFKPIDSSILLHTKCESHSFAYFTWNSSFPLLPDEWSVFLKIMINVVEKMHQQSTWVIDKKSVSPIIMDGNLMASD